MAKVAEPKAPSFDKLRMRLSTPTPLRFGLILSLSKDEAAARRRRS